MNETPLERVHTFFVSLVAKNVQADPLNGMKNDQSQSKYDQMDDSEGIGQEFSHSTKLHIAQYPQKNHERIVVFLFYSCFQSISAREEPCMRAFAQVLCN